MSKFKKTLALIAALTFVTAAFAGCGDQTESSTPDSSSSKSDSTTDSGDDSDTAEATLPSTGDTLTVMSWNDEFPKMVANYYIKDEGGNVEIKSGQGVESQMITNVDGTPLFATADELDPDNEENLYKDADGNPIKNDDGKYQYYQYNDIVEASLGDVAYDAKFFGVGGGQASTYYDAYFLTGEDIDLYCVEADFALKYLEGDNAAPLTDIGLTTSDFSKNYSYTLEIGTASDGQLKGVSFQAAPGGFVYRTDLAEEYLGVTTPEEMQEKVKDWDTFEASAKTVYDASGGKTAFTATLGGIWQVFSSARDTGWLNDDGKLAVTDDIKDFLTFAKNMTDAGYVTKIDQWSGEWYALGQTDNAMGYFVSTWGLKDTGTTSGNGFMTDAAGAVGGATYGKWNITEGPQPYFWGGTWLVVHPRCDNADLAKGVIEYFCVNNDSMKKYAKATGDFVNNTEVMAELVSEGTNSNGNLGGQDQFQVLNSVAESIDMDSSKISMYDATIKTEFQTVYGEYVDGADGYSTVDDAITKFKANAAAKGVPVE